MTTQVETIWSSINQSNCEVTRNRTFRSGSFGHGTFRSGDKLVTTFLYRNNFPFL